MTLHLVSRAAWGATGARDTHLLGPTGRRGVVIHWNGPKMQQPDHPGCDNLVRSIQRYHVQNKGWTDGAYSFVACQHGTVYELRGWHRYQFANGSLRPPAGTGDYSLSPAEAWYSVMVLTGGDHDSAGRLVDEQKPTPALLDALTALIDEARERGAGRAVKPHRAFRVKTCPGPTLAAFCARLDGKTISAPTPAPAPAPTTTGGIVSDLTAAEQRELLDLTRANARLLSPLAQRVADVERRQLAINTQEQARDAADVERDQADVERDEQDRLRDEALSAELAAARAELARLLELHPPADPPPPAPGPGAP